MSDAEHVEEAKLLYREFFWLTFNKDASYQHGLCDAILFDLRYSYSCSKVSTFYPSDKMKVKVVT